VTAYPSIETVYKTDDKVEVVTHWGKVGESMNHTFQWRVLDESGKVVAKDTDHNIPIRTYMWYSKPFNLNQANISAGKYTVRFYQDGELSMTREVIYSPQRVLNQNTKKVVVLPFADQSKETNLAPGSSVHVVDTVSHGLYCQVKRHFQEAVPHYVTKQEIGEPIPLNCLDQEACRLNLKMIFGDCILIYGSIILSKTKEETARLEVEAYNLITGEHHEYKSTVVQQASYNEILHDLMKNILVEKGFLNDLRSM
jgi:hypothetical protein